MTVFYVTEGKAEAIRSANRLCFPLNNNFAMSFRAPARNPPHSFRYFVSVPIHLLFIPDTQIVFFLIFKKQAKIDKQI